MSEAHLPTFGAASFSTTELQAISGKVGAALASANAETVLRLLPVDPWHLHAFWSVAAADWATAHAKLIKNDGRALMVLRFFDHTPMSAAAPRPHPPFDIEVQGLDNSWYIDVWKDGKTYVAELGLRGGTGEFISLARSSHVEMPAASASPDHDFQSAEVQLPPELIAETMAPPPAAAHFQPLFPRRDMEQVFPLIAEDDSPSQVALASEQDAVDCLGSDLPPLMPLALESVISLSSFTLGPEVELEINAELRIFGRARPNSTLNLFGRPVPLGPDGTFSITRELPNGALVLPLLLTGGPGGDR
jgi:hypothetical protein